MVYAPTLELSPLGSSRYEYDFGWLGTRANGTMTPPPPMSPVDHHGSACFVEPMVSERGGGWNLGDTTIHSSTRDGR